MQPVAYVHNARKEIQDDNWGNVESTIELVPTLSEEALYGLEEFSHIHVIFYFDKVKESDIEQGARHPRGNIALPKVGIFAQRAKNRPNRIGSTVCKLHKVEGNKIYVSGLDAIDDTPVLDIKPYMEEFDVRFCTLPEWTKEIMKNYF
jgi:tRNA-Thr(GGU) m(6)t(6)A37 methyltransferase TsaA